MEVILLESGGTDAVLEESGSGNSLLLERSGAAPSGSLVPLVGGGFLTSPLVK